MLIWDTTIYNISLTLYVYTMCIESCQYITLLQEVPALDNTDIYLVTIDVHGMTENNVTPPFNCILDHGEKTLFGVYITNVAMSSPVFMDWVSAQKICTLIPDIK